MQVNPPPLSPHQVCAYGYAGPAHGAYSDRGPGKGDILPACRLAKAYAANRFCLKNGFENLSCEITKIPTHKKNRFQMPHATVDD